MSKGSWKRPVLVPYQEYLDNFDAIDWGKKSEKQCCGRDHDHDGNCDQHPVDQDIKEGRAIRLKFTVGDHGTPPEEVR
jgi:hypothetical protein